MSMPTVAAAATVAGHYLSPYSSSEWEEETAKAYTKLGMELVKRRWERNIHASNRTVMVDVLRVCSGPWLWWETLGVNWMLKVLIEWLFPDFKRTWCSDLEND